MINIELFLKRIHLSSKNERKSILGLLEFDNDHKLYHFTLEFIIVLYKPQPYLRTRRKNIANENEEKKKPNINEINQPLQFQIYQFFLKKN